MSKIVMCKYDENEIYSLIKANLGTCIKESTNVDTKLHHAASYKSMLDVIKYGLLSKRKRAQILEGRELTEEELIKNDDEHCVCGSDYISIANTDFELDAYRDEEVYGIRDDAVNILLDGKFKYQRKSTNYADECLVEDLITPDHFTGFDIRLLKYIKNGITVFPNQNKEELRLKKISEIIEDYNSLIEVAQFMIRTGLDIPIREMSEDAPKTLLLEKVSALNPIK